MTDYNRRKMLQVMAAVPFAGTVIAKAVHSASRVEVPEELEGNSVNDDALLTPPVQDQRDPYEEMRFSTLIDWLVSVSGGSRLLNKGLLLKDQYFHTFFYPIADYTRGFDPQNFSVRIAYGELSNNELAGVKLPNCVLRGIASWRPCTVTRLTCLEDPEISLEEVGILLDVTRGSRLEEILQFGALKLPDAIVAKEELTALKVYQRALRGESHRIALTDHPPIDILRQLHATSAGIYSTMLQATPELVGMFENNKCGAGAYATPDYDLIWLLVYGRALAEVSAQCAAKKLGFGPVSFIGRHWYIN